MSQIYNIYCDESCHLEHDHQQVMVVGAVWCPQKNVCGSSEQIREIKVKHGLSRDFEVKWTKVSPGKVSFYLEILDFFFGNVDLHFRAVIVPDKSELDHLSFFQTHDEWYYKMYFEMLKVILSPDDSYNIYLDIKDTHSSLKVANLHDVLCSNMYDFSRKIIHKVQTVRSHEVEHLQLADLLIGTLSYANRGLSSSEAKNTLVDIMRKRSGYQLTRTTLLKEPKVNILVWHPAGET